MSRSKENNLNIYFPDKFPEFTKCKQARTERSALTAEMSFRVVQLSLDFETPAKVVDEKFGCKFRGMSCRQVISGSTCICKNPTNGFLENANLNFYAYRFSLEPGEQWTIKGTNINSKIQQTNITAQANIYHNAA